MGTVAAGKEASFNVLDANPADGITNTRRIAAVYLRGKELDRQALKARFMTRAVQGGKPGEVRQLVERVGWLSHEKSYQRMR